MRSNKVEYSTADVMYCTTNYFKVPFCVPEFSISKIINHFFHVDNYKGESGIGYDIIIGRCLMVQLVLTSNFKRQVLKWGGNNFHIKEPSSFLGKYDLPKRKICKVVMQTSEPVSI